MKESKVELAKSLGFWLTVSQSVSLLPVFVSGMSAFVWQAEVFCERAQI